MRSGPPPKDPSQRVRRNKDTAQQLPVPAPARLWGNRRAPALPKPGPLPQTTERVLKDRDGAEFVDIQDTPWKATGGWHPRTLAWWKTWQQSPQRTTFMATDWDFLTDTAAIHSWVYAGQIKLSGELRMRVAKYGATPDDRARLRMTFADADTKEAAASKAKAAKPAAAPVQQRYGTPKLRAVSNDE